MNMEVTEGDLELQCWFFDKPYTSMYLMPGGTHRTRALKFEIRHWTAVRNQVFVRLHNLEMFAARSNNCHLHYIAVPAFWRYWEALRVLCVPSPPMSAYYLSAFGDNAKRFGYLLLKAAMTKFTIMLFVCFTQADEYGAANSFPSARLRASAEDSSS